MNCTSRRLLLALAAMVLGAFAPARQLLAVTLTTSGSSFASQTTPPVVSDSDNHGATSSTSAASSSRSDAINGDTANSKAHAKSWASSKLSSGAVVKSASGTGWLDSGTPTYNSRSTAWTAYATGTPIIVNGPGPTVDLFLVIPHQSDPNLPDDGYDPMVLENATDPALMFRPRQELYADRVSMDPSTPSPFALGLTIDAVITQGGIQTFSGGAAIRPELGGMNSLQTTGGLAPAMFQEILHAGDPFRSHFAVVNDQLLATFTVQTGVPLDALLSVYMTMGGPLDPNGPLIPPLIDATPDMEFPPIIFDPLAMGIPRPAFGGGGSMTVLLIPPPGYQLSLVPEPSTWALLAVGGLAMAAAGWRRRQAV